MSSSIPCKEDGRSLYIQLLNPHQLPGNPLSAIPAQVGFSSGLIRVAKPDLKGMSWCG